MDRGLYEELVWKFLRWLTYIKLYPAIFETLRIEIPSLGKDFQFTVRGITGDGNLEEYYVREKVTMEDGIWYVKMRIHYFKADPPTPAKASLLKGSRVDAKFYFKDQVTPFQLAYRGTNDKGFIRETFWMGAKSKKGLLFKIGVWRYQG
jgi:hypothetical protein